MGLGAARIARILFVALSAFVARGALAANAPGVTADEIKFGPDNPAERPCFGL